MERKKNKDNENGLIRKTSQPSFFLRQNNIPSRTMIRPRVGVIVVDVVIDVVRTTFENGISQERLELLP